MAAGRAASGDDVSRGAAVTALAELAVGIEPDVAARLAARVRDVPDFPEPGILFKDITPLLADAGSFALVVDAMADVVRRTGATLVAGIEARGFILAAPTAARAGVGFVPIRKQGKLPAETLVESYALEYGEATIEVHADAFGPDERVLVVDDVLATGGTAAASVQLLRRAGSEPVGALFLIELGFLDGRSRLRDVPVGSLIRA